MNIGNLYLVKKWYWLVFPTRETAATASDSAAVVATSEDAVYCSKRFKCEVTYFSPDSIVVFLEEDGMLKQVLTADGKVGWTVFVDGYNDCFEEVKTEQ